MLQHPVPFMLPLTPRRSTRDRSPPLQSWAVAFCSHFHCAGLAAETAKQRELSELCTITLDFHLHACNVMVESLPSPALGEGKLLGEQLKLCLPGGQMQ